MKAVNTETTKGKAFDTTAQLATLGRLGNIKPFCPDLSTRLPRAGKIPQNAVVIPRSLVFLWAEFRNPKIRPLDISRPEKNGNVSTIKAGVNVKAVFTSPNTAFLPISRSRFKRRQIPMLITLSTIWQFCVNFWVIFRLFWEGEIFSQRIG